MSRNSYDDIVTDLAIRALNGQIMEKGLDYPLLDRRSNQLVVVKDRITARLPGQTHPDPRIIPVPYMEILEPAETLWEATFRLGPLQSLTDKEIYEHLISSY